MDILEQIDKLEESKSMPGTPRTNNFTLIQYSIITFFASLFFAIAMGVTLTSLSLNYLVDVHSSTYPTLTSLLIRNNPKFPEALRTVETDENTRATISSAVDPLYSIASVTRIKVWNHRTQVVWSDAEAIIGERYPGNREVMRALQGEVVSSYKRQAEPENRLDEQNLPQLEVYIPVRDRQNEVAGVIELYERNDTLIGTIHRTMTTIWLIIAGFSILLYAALFYIFYGSNRFNKRMIDELNITQDITIYALAYQAELRDNETGRHIDRTTRYVRLLAEELRRHPRYRGYINNDYVQALERSAPLHDIGKVGVPDHILRKPGALTPEEFKQIQEHPVNGAHTLRKASRRLGFTSFLELAIQLAESHHERWDGRGYPYQLSGEDIPLSGRIMAVADVYDALRSKRVYKPAYTHDACVRIIREESGRQFDPEIVQAFLRAEDQFAAISNELADAPETVEKHAFKAG